MARGMETHGGVTVFNEETHFNDSPEEPNFTKWTIKAIYDTNLPFNVAFDIIGVRNDGKVIWHDEDLGNTYIISPAGVLLASLLSRIIATFFTSNMRFQSVFAKYLVEIKLDWKTIVVEKGVTEVWTRDITLDKGAYSLASEPLQDWGYVGVAISPNGRWLAAQVKEATTNNCLVFIYEGS